MVRSIASKSQPSVRSFNYCQMQMHMNTYVEHLVSRMDVRDGEAHTTFSSACKICSGCGVIPIIWAQTTETPKSIVLSRYMHVYILGCIPTLCCLKICQHDDGTWGRSKQLARAGVWAAGPHQSFIFKGAPPLDCSVGKHLWANCEDQSLVLPCELRAFCQQWTLNLTTSAKSLPLCHCPTPFVEGPQGRLILGTFPYP